MPPFRVLMVFTILSEMKIIVVKRLSKRYKLVFKNSISTSERFTHLCISECGSHTPAELVPSCWKRDAVAFFVLDLMIRRYLKLKVFPSAPLSL